MDAKACKKKGGAWDANRNICYNFKRTEKVLKQMEALTIAGLETDGSHHKQWFLEEMAKKLKIPDEKLLYFEKGVAP